MNMYDYMMFFNVLYKLFPFLLLSLILSSLFLSIYSYYSVYPHIISPFKALCFSLIFPLQQYVSI